MEISCRPFDMADVDGGPELRLAMAASVFAGMRANSPEDPWKNIGQSVDLVRTVVAFFKSRRM